MSRPADATLVLATDPDGARHVLVSATRAHGRRAVRHGLVGLSSDAKAGSLAQLVTPTCLADDEQLADLLAHLVTAVAAEPDDAPRPIDLVTLCSRGTPNSVPDALNGPFGRDFEVRALDASAVVRDALLVASDHAPGGPWWAPVDGADDDLVAFGQLLARAGLLGTSPRTVVDGPRPFDTLEAAALEAALRGTEPPPGVEAVALRADEGRVRWSSPVHEEDDAERPSFTTPRWSPEHVAALDAARGNALAPYTLVLFARSTATGANEVQRVVAARRHLVGAVEAREAQEVGA